MEPAQLDVVKGFIPWCENCSYIEMKHLIGIVGSIVMPHNIYFHSTLVLVSLLFTLFELNLNQLFY